MSEQRKRKPTRAPISAHPAFPAIVALWFAALLGLGSLVLPTALFEALSESIGLSQYLVAAQPPLGSTARVIIALGTACTGALAGLTIARQIVAAKGLRAGSRVVTPPATEVVLRPISAHDELGEDGFDADFAGHAAKARAPDATADFRSDFSPDRDAAFEPPVVAALDLGDFENAEDELDDWVAEDARREARDLAALAAEKIPTAVPVVEEVAASQNEAGNLSMVEFAPDGLAPGGPEAAADAPFAQAAGPVAIIELVDRFARALQQHREQAAAQVASDPVVDVTAAFSAKPAPPSTAPDPRTQASAPLDTGDDAYEEDEDLEAKASEGYSSLLGMNRSLASPRKAVAIHEEDDASDDAEGAASEPVVAFPSQPGGIRHPARAAVPSDTERALRDALEKLEKMSGAA